MSEKPGRGIRATCCIVAEFEPGSLGTRNKKGEVALTKWIHRSVIFAVLMAPGMAFAQDSNEQTQSTEDDGLAPIVVTAQRRTENLQKVPIAATALSGDDLEKKAVERIADLQFVAPSLTVTDAGLTQSVNIRGIGIASGSPAVANGVATYINGIFQPPVLTTSSFYDIQGIEVLRGPQGTLVGSNSTGGAMLITTRTPSTSGINGYARASYGTYNAASGEGAINLPLSSTLAVRAAGTIQSRDSYYTDAGPLHNKPGRFEEYAGRVSLLWEPSSNFRALGHAEWIDKNTGGYAYQPMFGTAYSGDRTSDVRLLHYNSPTLNYERGFMTDLELRYTTDSGIVFRSLTGYTFKRISNLYDSDASTLATQTLDQYTDERQYSQEINIISPADASFNWILGGYYQRNKVGVDIQSKSGSPVDPTDVVQSQDKTTWGIFAHTSYKFSPALELQVGARYSNFDATGGGSVTIGNGSPFFPPGGLVVANLAGTHSDGRMTGKVALNWTPDKDNLFYIFAARGYKPGGANSATSEFGPETVWDYELGWKSSFLSNHVRTQLGAFYMSYKDFQFDALDRSSGQSGVTNISNATIKGIEGQIQLEYHGFGLDGGFAYVDSKVNPVTVVDSIALQRARPELNGQYGPQCAAGVPSNPPTCFDYSPYLRTAGGGSNLFSPKWTYNIGIEYVAKFGDGFRLRPRLNFGYVGPSWTNLFYNRATDYLLGRGLLSGQITLSKDNWSIEAYGTNLADKIYVSGGGTNQFYGAPREYGVRASMNF